MNSEPKETKPPAPAPEPEPVVEVEMTEEEKAEADLKEKALAVRITPLLQIDHLQVLQGYTYAARSTRQPRMYCFGKFC